MSKIVLFKNLLLILTLIVCSLTFYSKYISKPEPSAIPAELDEYFDPALSAINSPFKLDSLVREKFVSSGYDTAQTLIFIDGFMRNRFFHSYSELSLHDNWIAFLCGQIIWSHFLNPVVPEDILKQPMAGCSQQGIIFQDQLHRLNIRCASIKFTPLPDQTSGHYAVSAYYGHTWHFFDSNLEPIIVDSGMPSVEEIIERKIYTEMYTREIHNDFKKYFLNKNYKRVIAKPFERCNMHYFQVITAFLSNWLWLILLTLYGLFWFSQRPKTK